MGRRCGAAPVRLYACTAPRSDNPNECCMRLASLSPLLQFPEEHREWLCAQCRAWRPASDSSRAPRRLLKLYPPVQVMSGHSTPMKSGHIAALVHPPPASFCWPQDNTETVPSVHEKTPSRYGRESRSITFVYDQGASDFIWRSAASFGSQIDMAGQ